MTPPPVESTTPAENPETYPLPPGTFGLPLVGETFEFLRSSRLFCEKRSRLHGPAFRSHVLGSKTVFLLGAEANQWVFAGEGKYLRNRWNSGTRRLLGARCLALLEGGEHLERRRLLAPHFSYVAMRGFVPTIESITTRHLERWAARPGDFTLWDSMRELAFEIALALIFGEDRVDVPFLLKHFQRWTAGLFTPVPVALPFTTFGRALASKQAMMEYLDRVVAERRALAEQPADLLGALLNSRDDAGQPLPSDVIRDELQLLLFAGHDTTVTATSNLMLQLASNPEALRLGREAVAGLNGPLTLDSLRGTPALARLISEGMRLVPPIGGLFRSTTRDAVYKGYRIPKGWTVMLNVGFTHRHTNWTEPTRFDPERFGPERNEQRTPGSFIPFGGGPRTCLGQHFAMVEMSVLLALLLNRYAWELVPGQDLTYSLFPFPRPRSGIQIRFRHVDEASPC